ncbi:MAG: FHA domain-containing protein [Burkholderiales bacterium]|nr:FHA domain-containing protein [Burkholderiales bacterium]
MAPDQGRTSAAGQEFDIVLKPISHPELGDICIEENLFAIGRSEAPFGTYAPEVVSDLSRRHARIFAEYGGVFVADMGSKNGTKVNGASVKQKVMRLQDGDEICFAGTLCYRVQLKTRPRKPRQSTKLASLSLLPEHNDHGLQPIVITQFPFLVSKTDDVFARYKESHPHQVNYISRRHAHIFVKGSQAYIEDLGSTNGTFVAGKRLDERAVQLHDGDVLAFGGNHFVYRVSLVQEMETTDPTVTKLSPSARQAAQAAAGGDKTTFVAAANSFLDIFCVDQAQAQEDEINADAKPLHEAPSEEAPPPRGKFAALAAELTKAFAGEKSPNAARNTRRAMIAAAVVAILIFAAYLRGWPQRNVQSMITDARYEQAAMAANHYLKSDPEDTQMRALAGEALLKAYVPRWWNLIKARRFDQAAATIAIMKKFAVHNADAQPLISELEWLGEVEAFVAARGGADAPIKSPADEEGIKRILAKWDEERERHQSAFATISLAVPDFRDFYAQTLSHLRKLALTGSQRRDSNEQGKPLAAPNGGAGGS